MLQHDINYFRCFLREEHTPKSLKLKRSIRNIIPKHMIWKIERKIIKSVIRSKVKKWNNLKYQLRKLLQQHSYKENPHKGIANGYKYRKDLKLHKLFKYPVPKMKNMWINNLIVNKTNIQIPTYIKQFLTLGIDFNIPIEKITMDLIASIDKSIKDLPIKKDKKTKLINSVIQDIKHISQKNKFKVNKYKTNLNKTINFLKTNNLAIIKADKTRQLIIITNEELENKSKEQIDNEQYTKLVNNPYEKIKKDLTKIVKEMHSKGNISDTDKNNIINFNNNRTPKLHIRLKTHKKEEKYRPIVDFRYSILYNLENYIKQKLKSIENSKNSIKNADEAINIIQKIKKEKTDTLISLDVKNMYPNIKWKLVRDSLTNLNISKTLIDLTQFAYQRNYFEVYNEFYRQTDGVSMGSKMGPKLAELVMIEIDKKIQNIPGIKTVMRSYVWGLYSVYFFLTLRILVCVLPSRST
ncbi:uncharacterized protein LOC111615607 [Centruroides sculpturatus]|uniref:uncharacterized protein LOC111615607 n=1 Tax=Centruroides sculpturatus TaxID=218467 RepID=UPI000C6E09F9|nr:uncharacterized protein LOC111615607 [Centruroides sculpturatus]